MKMQLIAAALMAITGVAQAALPEGSFKGEGLWKNAEKRGDYKVSTEIKGQMVSSVYTLADGTTKEWKMEMKPGANGFFEVLSGTNVVGKGYCLEYVSLCHYEVKSPALELEETITQQDGKLYKFGSKTEGEKRIMFQEALE